VARACFVWRRFRWSFSSCWHRGKTSSSAVRRSSRKLWGKDVFLDTEQGINTAIRKIRLVLRDDPENPGFLQTVVGKGYRLVGPIALVGNGHKETAPTSPGQSSPPANPTRRQSYFLTIAAVVLGVATAAAVVIAIVNPALRDRLLNRNPGIHSIVVLPLDNLSGDPAQEYFADGMTDALITDLAQIHSLRVISRTSAVHYQGSHKSLPEIAKELNVDAVVEGTVSRSGNRVRITAQLIHAPTDRHLWAESYERNLGDVLGLQGETLTGYCPRSQRDADAARATSADQQPSGQS